MADETTVPIFDPQGQVRMVPQSQANDAMNAGGKLAVKMQAPDGSQRWVPNEMVDQATASDGKVLSARDLGPNPNLRVPAPSDYLSVAKDLGKGFIKSAGQTLFGSGTGAGDSSFANAKVGFSPEQQANNQATAQQFRSNLQPQGAVQNIGAAAEQTAEMALTGGPLRGAAGMLPQVAQRGGRIAAEAINTASNAAMHGQDPASAALAGTGGAALSELLPSMSGFLKEVAQKQYTKALAPTKEVNKNLAQKIVPGLIDRGVIGSPESIAGTANANLGLAGQAVNAAENAIPQGASQDVSSVISRLDSIRNKYTISGMVPTSRQPTVDYIDSIKNDILSRSQAGQMPTSDIIQFRRMLDEPVAQGGGFAGRDVLGNKKIDKAAANSMREILNNGNPDLAAANASYSFWSNVRQVAGDTAKRQTGQQGAVQMLMTGAGIAGGLGHGGMSAAGASEAAAGAGAMYILSGMVRSPQWRTASAVLKNRLADALASDNAERFFRAAADFSAANASQLTSRPGGR